MSLTSVDERHAARAADVKAAFAGFVRDPSFPCLAGKGVVNSDGHDVHVYGMLGSHRSSRALARDLGAFSAAMLHDEPWMKAFVAVFPTRPPRDESEFDARLWRQLQRLHDLDAVAWSGDVSSDPDDARFSFSFGGAALFVVGMHPASSRIARRFQYPALVFNPRAQFDRLRSTGRFERLRAVVREREIALQGSINPNLADFGEQSDARQYSGQVAGTAWRCPFHARTP
jgi:hypothetical protein